MKKLIFALLSFLSLQANLKANHNIGGEITWECLSNGKFLFNFILYKDVPGAWTVMNETIIVSGATLPQNSNNNQINSIIVYPVNSSRYTLNTNYHFYQSDTIQLKGVPPASGWTFTYELNCCRTGVDNMNVNNPILYVSKMYPSKNLTPVDSCFDSSPQFKERPKRHYASGVDYHIADLAFDQDDDSLEYGLGLSFVGPTSNTTTVAFKPAYSLSSYTNDQTFDSRNLPYNIQSDNGLITFSDYATNSVYGILTKVNSYREGALISTIYREIKTMVQPRTVEINRPLFKGLPFNGISKTIYDTVSVGDTLRMPISIIDTSTRPMKEVMTMVPHGFSFSNDFVNRKNCRNPKDTSCAILNYGPYLNFATNPPRYEISTTDSISIDLEWIIDCNHLDRDGSSKTHFFNFGYEADSSANPFYYSGIAITVIPSGSCNLVSLQGDKPQKLENEINLFPNPNTGVFNLNVTGDYGWLTIEIRNIAGQLVNKQQFNSASSMELSINGEAGIYFVQVQNENGERANLKVVKQ